MDFLHNNKCDVGGGRWLCGVEIEKMKNYSESGLFADESEYNEWHESVLNIYCNTLIITSELEER